MLTIGELVEKSHAMAVEKGWYEMDGDMPIKRSMESVICLFHSEVSEILEAYRDSSHKPDEVWFSNTGKPEGKPEGVTIEIADLFIRIADTAKIEKGFDSDFDDRFVRYLWRDRLMGKIDLYYEQMYESTFNRVIAASCPSIEEMIFASHKLLSSYDRALARINRLAYWQVLQFLMLIWSRYCFGNDWDLETAIKTKMAYNATRPIRHGNKRL